MPEHELFSVPVLTSNSGSCSFDGSLKLDASSPKRVRCAVVKRHIKWFWRAFGATKQSPAELS
jgi:hypothetical protein